MVACRDSVCQEAEKLAWTACIGAVLCVVGPVVTCVGAPSKVCRAIKWKERFLIGHGLMHAGGNVAPLVMN